jgi:hypothetical protein
MVRLAQTAHLSCVKISSLQTDSNKLPLEARHLGVLFAMSKTISEPMEHSTQAVHLYCTDTNTISKRTETRFHMTLSARSSIGSIQDDFRADGIFDTNCTPILRQDYHYLQTESNKLPLELRHLGESLGVSKMISVPMVRSMQAVRLYCTDTNTIPKQTEMGFHMTHSPWSSIGCVQDDF